jgi:hypothetical protein
MNSGLKGTNQVPEGTIICLAGMIFVSIYTFTYKTSRKPVDINTGNVSLKARATDETNGVPLKGVIFTFTPESARANLAGGNG